MKRSQFHYCRMAMLRPPFWLSANGKVCRVEAGNEPGSGSCYAEVVVEDCYGLFKYYKGSEPRVIVDIGANVGVFSKLCSLLFPQADIYSYEPNPSALTWLTRNAEGTRIQINSCAVGLSSGVVNLDTSCDSTIGRITDRGGSPVDCMPASEVAEGRQIDFLKMDCEGSEWSILQDTSLLNRTRDFCMEFHLFDDHTIEELRRLIEKAGHEVVSVSNTREGGKFGLIRSTHRSKVLASH